MRAEPPTRDSDNIGCLKKHPSHFLRAAGKWFEEEEEEEEEESSSPFSIYTNSRSTALAAGRC